MNTSDKAKIVARELRKNQTRAEKLLWEKLRNKRFAGLKFKEVYWLNNELIFNFFLPRSFVYDVFKRKIIHEFEGTVMGWSADRRYVVSYKNKEAIVTETISGKIIDRIKIRG